MRDAKKVAEEVWFEIQDTEDSYVDPIPPIAKAIHDARAEALDLAANEVRNLLNWVHDIEQDASELQLASLLGRIKNLHTIQTKKRKKT